MIRRLLLLLLLAADAFALDGGEDVFFTVPDGMSNGWKTFEIITAEDTTGTGSLGSLAVEGFTWDGQFEDWDGLGAYRHDADTLRVFINHETGPGSTFSRVDLNVPNLKAWVVSGIANNTHTNQVLPAGPVLEAMSLGWLTVASGSDPINNPCSGNVWLAETFGEGRGLAEGLFLTAEEVFGPRNGHFWILDLATRALYEAVDLGDGSWENATLVDTGRTDTIALVLSEDFGSAPATGNAPIRLYVGQKNPAGNFLERNGLSGGTVYYWHASGVSTAATNTGLFASGNGTVVAGTWETTSVGAALFSKCEDVHVNLDRDSRGYGVEVALAAENQGVFKIDLSTVEFVSGGLSPGQVSEVTLLYQEGTQAGANVFTDMDNLVWSADGMIYVNEDDGEGDIWVIDPASLEASYATSDFTPDAGQVFDILDADLVKESSGIIDVSEHLDYQPGSIFLTAGHSPTVELNQLAMAVSPGAATMASAYDNWVLGFPALDTAAKRLQSADPDGDGLDNLLEFAFDLAPDHGDEISPFSATPGPSSTTIRFRPARSLDLLSYRLEYTPDLGVGFVHTVEVRATHLAGDGSAEIEVPRSGSLFMRLRVEQR